MTSPEAPNQNPSTAVTARPEVALSRAALERVLARATELAVEGIDDVDTVSESRIMEIAREVGIDPAHLRQAIAEERARLPMQEIDRGPILDALGSASTSVQRVVPGTPAEVLAKLDAWLPKMESLSPRRRATDRVSWEPRHDPLGNFFRSFGMGGRRLDLVRVDEMVVSVTAVDEQRTVVRFDASAYGARRAQRTSFLVLAGLLVLMAIVLSIPLLFLASGGAVGAGFGVIAALTSGLGYVTWRAIRKGYRLMIDRAHLRLEQMLDELEIGGMQPPPSLARQVAGALLR
ncbi:MAG: hypothetical protein IT354_04900 [Gemmatimonadaceae bacterium]|nr:hypothetical protein [Gemmatimonadaceae bacterium]